MWGCLISANIFLSQGQLIVAGAWFGAAVIYAAFMDYEEENK
jgi:hypothetical protein